MARQAEELEQRRRAAQEELRRQLQGEHKVVVEGLESEFDRNLREERQAASARLLQKHQKLKHEHKLAEDQLTKEAERSTAELLRQYADGEASLPSPDTTCDHLPPHAKRSENRSAAPAHRRIARAPVVAHPVLSACRVRALRCVAGCARVQSRPEMPSS